MCIACVASQVSTVDGQALLEGTVALCIQRPIMNPRATFLLDRRTSIIPSSTTTMSSAEIQLDPISVAILSFTTKLDEVGALEWNLYVIAVVTALFLFTITLTLGNKWGIDWLAFIHALVTGVGGIICVYLDFYAAEAMTGLPGERGSKCLHHVSQMTFVRNSQHYIPPI